MSFYDKGLLHIIMKEIKQIVKVRKTNWMREIIQNQIAVKIKKDRRTAKPERGKNKC